MANELPDLCSNCGAELAAEELGEDRRPCPNCGSTRRTKQAAMHATATMRASVEARIIRAWDSNSLTLAGVIFGIVATVIGVVVATMGRLATAIYAVVTLALLATGLLRAQPIIRAMRWLLERGKR
jgi:predicted RNA-binding Zn-ribbon protein involved in translation (DUF1610 family)